MNLLISVEKKTEFVEKTDTSMLGGRSYLCQVNGFHY